MESVPVIEEGRSLMSVCEHCGIEHVKSVTLETACRMLEPGGFSVRWTDDALRTASCLVRQLRRQAQPPVTMGIPGSAHRPIGGRDIGEIPPVVNPERRAAAERSFRFFCEQYFPRTFSMAWSTDHIKVIAKLEDCVLRGGSRHGGLPRGAGRTSISTAACLWAVLYGHRRFVVMVGFNRMHAEDAIQNMKNEIEHNSALLEDFPEVVYPIRSLAGIHQRAGGQLYQGKPTHIGWTAKEMIVLPTIPGSRTSGAVVRSTTSLKEIRGMQHECADGGRIRPTLALIDVDRSTEDAFLDARLWDGGGSMHLYVTGEWAFFEGAQKEYP